MRQEVEKRLRAGNIRCVVCTASLDLGVDFSPVEQVIQIGAPKGVARMLQRAGRSGHQPGAVSRIVCVPAHALELVEFSAVREAIAARELESRIPLERPLDVLVQHLVTVALGSGFREAAMLAEVRSSHAYRESDRRRMEVVPGFRDARRRHAEGLSAIFPRPASETAQISPCPTPSSPNCIACPSARSPATARWPCAWCAGRCLGPIEESFIGRLKPGAKFSFAGHALELVRVRDMTAYVRRTKKFSGVVPQWMGGRMPLSSQLAKVVRRKLVRSAPRKIHRSRNARREAGPGNPK